MGTRRRASSGRAMRGARDGARDAPEDARGGDAMESSRRSTRHTRVGGGDGFERERDVVREILEESSRERDVREMSRARGEDAVSRREDGRGAVLRAAVLGSGRGTRRASRAGGGRLPPERRSTRHPRGSKRRATPGSARPGVLRRDVRREGRRDRTGRDGGIDARSIPLVGCRTGVDVDHEPLVGVVPVQPRSHASARAAFAAGHHTPSSGRARAACGQTCNHAVVNRYRDEDDAIGAHADKTLDLEDDSYVVSVRLRRREDDDVSAETSRHGKRGGTRSCETRVEGARGDARARRRVARRRRGEKRRRAEERRETRAATARERTRAATLRETNDDVAAAAAAAREARRAWIRERENAAFETTLEPGSALFFNMAFNDAWTHAIRPAGGRSRRRRSLPFRRRGRGHG